MTQSRIIVDDTGITREVQISADKVSADIRSTDTFFDALADRVPFDTGLMPPGLLSYRQAGPHSQIVLQSPPDINRILWGRYEGDRDAGHYLVAQPWRIQICDMVEEDLLGCRMFYSPVQISHSDQPLYMTNVPNTNSNGYGGTGIGWNCLYHHESWKGWTLAQKIARILERLSGAEAYNDQNMSETDGPRFYQAHKKPAYTYRPGDWEKKSKKEGVGWTLNPDLWIPALVTDIDDQDRYNGNGVPLTLHMAMTGRTGAYYNDRIYKMQNRIARGEVIPPKELASQFNAAFVKAKPLTGDTVESPRAEQEDVEKEIKLLVNLGVPVGGFEGNVIFDDENEEDYEPDFDWYCAGCQQGYFADDGTVCPNCGIDCSSCGEVFNPDDVHEIKVKANEAIFVLCYECFEKSRICTNCGHLVQEFYTTQEQTFLCFGCVSWCAGCNRPFQGTASLAICPQCEAAGYAAVLTP